MSLTIELPPALEAALTADATAQGRAPSALVLELLAARYARAEEDAALRAALSAPARPFDPDAPRRKFGLPLGRTPEEVAAAAVAEVAALDPEKRAEAERLGLL
jgi:hypothetical protein